MQDTPGSSRPAERPAMRLGPLALLPLFADLNGRPALVAGSGPAAAWKVELLAATGAAVRVAAPAPCPELAGLIAAKHPIAIQGTVRAIWEALGQPRALAVANALKYTQLGNPISTAEVSRAGIKTPPWKLR